MEAAFVGYIIECHGSCWLQLVVAEGQKSTNFFICLYVYYLEFHPNLKNFTTVTCLCAVSFESCKTGSGVVFCQCILPIVTCC